jgi:hypothetical protein
MNYLSVIWFRWDDNYKIAFARQLAIVVSIFLKTSCFLVFDASVSFEVIVAFFDFCVVSFDGLVVVGAVVLGFETVEAEAVGVEHAHCASVFQGFAAAVTVGLGEKFVHFILRW